jgi:hypothetical protein
LIIIEVLRKDHLVRDCDCGTCDANADGDGASEETGRTVLDAAVDFLANHMPCAGFKQDDSSILSGGDPVTSDLPEGLAKAFHETLESACLFLKRQFDEF